MFLYLFVIPENTVIKALDMDRIMNDYGDELLRLCTMYLKDCQLAEDALQDAFIKVFRKYDSFKGASSEKTWITSIVINVCKDYLRKKFNREISTEDEMLHSSTDTTPEDAFVESERNSLLFDAVRNLSPIYKEVILLYYYSGFSLKEIAKIVNAPQSTINVRLKRARDMLRLILKEEVS